MQLPYSHGLELKLAAAASPLSSPFSSTSTHDEKRIGSRSIGETLKRGVGGGVAGDVLCISVEWLRRDVPVNSTASVMTLFRFA